MGHLVRWMVNLWLWGPFGVISGGPFGVILGRSFSGSVCLLVFLCGLLLALWAFWWMVGHLVFFRRAF